MKHTTYGDTKKYVRDELDLDAASRADLVSLLQEEDVDSVSVDMPDARYERAKKARQSAYGRQTKALGDALSSMNKMDDPVERRDLLEAVREKFAKVRAAFPEDYRWGVITDQISYQEKRLDSGLTDS